MEGLVQQLFNLPAAGSFLVFVIGTSRALGALFGLWGLYFVLGPAALMRMVLAVVIAAPLMVGQLDGLVALASDTPRFELLLIPVREFAIGFVLGLLASLPFFSVLGAAMLVDQYRGDFAPGLQGPEDQTVGSYAMLNAIMVLFLFVEAGGFMVLISVLYESYGILEPSVPSLSVSPDFAGGLGRILQNIMVGLVIFALPVILILMLLEFGVSMLDRMSEQIKTPTIDFLIKNIALTLAMPFLAYGLMRLMQKLFDEAPDPLPLLLRFISP